MSVFILSFCFAEEIVKDKEHSYKFDLVMMQPAANTQTMAHDEASKNQPGGINDTPGNEKEARMCETEEKNDGYKALKLHLEKVNPKCSAFFQYPKPNVRPEEKSVIRS